jgi:hypothetical protein
MLKASPAFKIFVSPHESAVAWARKYFPCDRYLPQMNRRYVERLLQPTDIFGHLTFATAAAAQASGHHYYHFFANGLHNVKNPTPDKIQARDPIFMAFSVELLDTIKAQEWQDELPRIEY